MEALILKLDVAGRPIRWITREEGALLYCRDQVAWEAGERSIRLHGGRNRLTGERSFLDINTIVATTAIDKHGIDRSDVPALTNPRLCNRDKNTCLYCGGEFATRDLTRDHVIPVSRGGEDTWSNVVSACKPCNHRKADRLLDELSMRLLAVPYVPNRAEGLILANRKILADQMAFLKAKVSKESRWLYG